MSLPKGRTNNPKGKPKGTLSAKTKRWDALMDDFDSKHTDRFNRILDSAANKEFMSIYLQLLEYRKPKLARTELTGDKDNPIELSISEKTADAINKFLSSQ